MYLAFKEYNSYLKCNSIQSTPDKSDSQGTGKIIRLSEMSDLSEIQNIMQIRRAMHSVS